MSAIRIDERHDRPLELAALAVDFDLNAAEASELEAHLAGCPSCTRRVAAMRSDARALSRPLVVQPGSRVDQAVSAAIAGHRSLQPQRLLLLAAAALLLLAMLGAVAVGATYLRSLEDRPTSDLPLPSQPEAVVRPDPDASPAALGETWSEMPFDVADGGRIEGVTFAGSDLVGVGRGGCVVDSDGAGSCDAAAWSTPGGHWVRAPGQPGLEVGRGQPTSGPPTGIFDVTDGPAGLVAIGYDNGPLPGSCPVAPCTSGPAVWRSADGRTWERVQVDFGPGFIDTFSEPIAAIAAGADAYVMVGYTQGVGPSGDTEARATAWASPDGVTWTRANHSEDLTLGGCVEAGQQTDCGGMKAVASTPSGFVAVGSRYEGGTVPSPAAWTSPDGLNWTLTMAGLDFQGDLAAVTAGPAGVVAGGTLCSAQDCYGTGAILGSDGAWTVPPPNGLGMGPIKRLASTGESYLGLTWADDALALWRSDDGSSWRSVSTLPAMPDVVDYRGVDLIAAQDGAIIAGWADVDGTEGTRNFAYQSPASTDTVGPDVALDPAADTPIAGTLPITEGSVRMAPGPDGGLYVVSSSTQTEVSGPPSRTVLALLDESGAPRPGWPIELAGWTCLRPGDDEAPWTPSTDAEGSLQVVCFSDEAANGTWRTTAFAFDPGAGLIGSWPLTEGAFDSQPRILDSRLHAISRDANAPDTIWMTTVEADGTVRGGQQITIAGLGQLQLGPDGTGYGMSYTGADGAGAVRSEVQAFDMAGPRAGWPVHVDGFVPSVAFGSDGRIYATSELDGFTSRTYGFDAGGRSLASASRVLPITAANEWSGAGPGRAATMLAPDGTVFVRGESSGRTFVFGLDPSGAIMDGWPYVSTVEPQWKGACSGLDQGCGVWQATNAVGPDGTLHLIQAAPHDKTGGSIVAIAPDGTVRPGWPVYLTRAGAAFWSVVVGDDGTAYALAVEPEAGGTTSATILAIAPDSTVRYRTTVVEP